MKQLIRRIGLKLALWWEDIRDAKIGTKLALLVGAVIVLVLLAMGFIALAGIILTAAATTGLIGGTGASTIGAEKTSVIFLSAGALVWIGAAIILAPIAAIIFRVAGIRDARRRWLVAAAFAAITVLLVKVYTLAVDTSVSGVAPALAFLGIGLVVIGSMVVLLCQARFVGTLGAVLGLLVLGAATWQLGWPTWVSVSEEHDLRASHPEDAVMSPTGVARYCRPVIPQYDDLGRIVARDIWPEVPEGFATNILTYRCDPNNPGREPRTGLKGTVLTPEDNLRLQATLPRRRQKIVHASFPAVTPRDILTASNNARSTGTLENGECSPVYVGSGSQRFGWTRPTQCVWVKVNGKRLERPVCPGDQALSLPPIDTLQFCAPANIVTSVTVCADWGGGTCSY